MALKRIAVSCPHQGDQSCVSTLHAIPTPRAPSRGPKYELTGSSISEGVAAQGKRNSIVEFINRKTLSALVSHFRPEEETLREEDVSMPFELNKVDVYNFPAALCINHPTLQLMIDRKLKGSVPKWRRDGCKLGLVIEGGGMRGAVSGAMGMALRRLGFCDVFDCVYGSSAGAVNGAYFLTGQEMGMDIYFEHLANKRFIDFGRLFGPDPVLDLDYLIDTIMEEVVPLDWDRVLKSRIPLKVIASSLDQMSSVTLGAFANKNDLATALKASCTVPEIVGPPEVMHGQRLVDAAVFEPIPYKAAIQDGCTHVLALCSRPRPRGARGRVRRAMKQILDRAIKRLVLSPPYMQGAWRVEVEEMLKAGGMNADDLMLLTMMQGLQRMDPTPMDGQIFAIYPSPKHIIPPTSIDGALLKIGARDAGKAVETLFEPLAKNMQRRTSWLFI